MRVPIPQTTEPDTAGMAENPTLDIRPDDVVVTAGDIEIGRYVFAPDAPAVESPKPYWHPLRALDGGLVTGYRPWDHRWHKGLQMTWTHVSGDNFWGGPSFVQGEGYVWLDNVGRIRHDGFSEVVASGPDVGMSEQLTWIAASGQEWLSETRTHRFPILDRERGYWVLDFATTLRNIRGADLHLGSPTTAGRPAAGYTGLFLRMPRAWTGGEVIAAGDRTAGDLMGRAADWVGFTGQHDDVDGGATVLAFAGTSSAAPAIRWFVRSEPIPVLAPSPSFDQEIVLRDGEELALTHRHVFLDRVWRAAELAELAEELHP
ncbi:Methane oxygenase PmoA [Microbacterium pygmaeum]|uniref:Methane oxygenase PmoA n=2 Tax=Microbacterium pygmaeum TaxID=370764 RepID=A0A1G7W631_9MICO|nr:Methane oxygenase PmoA [Microbacterium pygmaeum]